MPSKYLRPDERVVRYVSWAKMRKNEEETEIYGPLGTAFRLRDGEKYLSVTWCEYFGGTAEETMRCAAEAIRNSEIDVRPRACFVVGIVNHVDAFMRAKRRRIRFIHEPADDNAAHAAVRGWPSDDDELLERIAEEVWNEVWTKSDVDNVPNSPCSVSKRGLAPQ